MNDGVYLFIVRLSLKGKIGIKVGVVSLGWGKGVNLGNVSFRISFTDVTVFIEDSELRVTGNGKERA